MNMQLTFAETGTIPLEKIFELNHI